MTEEDSLIRDVNDAMRQEKMQNLWRLIGRYVVIASVLIVLVTIGYVVVDQRRQAAQQANTAKLYDAIALVEDGKSFQAREAFEALSQSDDASLAMMARIWLVKLKYQAGKQEEAKAMATALMEEHAVDGVYRDLAAFYAGLDVAEQEGAFRHTASEQQALQAYVSGDKTKAAELYAVLAQDSETPSTMRTRANFLIDTELKPYLPTKEAELSDELAQTANDAPADNPLSEPAP